MGMPALEVCLICGSPSSTLSVVLTTSLNNQSFFHAFFQDWEWNIFEASALEMCLSLLLAWQSPGQVAGQAGHRCQQIRGVPSLQGIQPLPFAQL